MNKQFTASEVRAEIDQAFRYHVNDMLRAFADLLEERERAVPVVTRESAINAIEHVGRYNGPGRETEARLMLVEGSPSVANRAPSDAKRLAEALRTIQHSMQQAQIYGNDSRREIKLSASVCEQALAAHHAQAQPPAASVTDAMVERGLKACIQDSDARLPRYKVVRSIIEAALAAQENPNGGNDA